MKYNPSWVTTIELHKAVLKFVALTYEFPETLEDILMDSGDAYWMVFCQHTNI